MKHGTWIMEHESRMIKTDGDAVGFVFTLALLWPSVNGVAAFHADG